MHHRRTQPLLSCMNLTTGQDRVPIERDTRATKEPTINSRTSSNSDFGSRQNVTNKCTVGSKGGRRSNNPVDIAGSSAPSEDNAGATQDSESSPDLENVGAGTRQGDGSIQGHSRIELVDAGHEGQSGDACKTALVDSRRESLPLEVGGREVGLSTGGCGISDVEGSRDDSGRESCDS